MIKELQQGAAEVQTECCALGQGHGSVGISHCLPQVYRYYDCSIYMHILYIIHA